MKNLGKVPQLSIRHGRNAWIRSFRCDIYFVCVTGKIRHKSYREIVFTDDAPAVQLFRSQYVLKKKSSGLGEMPLTSSGFDFECAENKISRVNLAMWMRI